MSMDPRAAHRRRIPGPFAEPLTRNRNYTTAPRTWVAGELVTASMMNSLRDLFLELEAGTSDTPIGLKQSFQGLTLRTHPNADVAAYKVYLDHADEIIMHDGVSVLDWNDLTADITVSGANGLDTSTEVASTWYEIHAIRNSSTGTKGLLLHRAKNYLLDQSFTTTNDADGILRKATGTATDKLAQGVTFAIAGVVPFVDLKLAKYVLSAGDEMWVTLEADSGGSPSGTPLATSDKLDPSLVGQSNYTETRFIFRSPPTVTASLYHIVLQGNYTRNDTNAAYWAGVAAGGYSGGSAKQFNGTTWSAATGVGDFRFKTYVIQNDTAVTMPSGYDQRALIGWVYNNSASDLIAMRAQDREVTIYSSTMLNALTSTVNTLTTLAEHVPPVPVLLTRFQLMQNTSGAYTGLLPGLDNSDHSGNLYQQTANYTVDHYAGMAVSFQHLYAFVSAGATYAYLKGYRW